MVRDRSAGNASGSSYSLRALVTEYPDFRRLLLASVISLAGNWFSFVAVADLVTELTASPGAAAFVYAASVLPVFLASPLAGSVADRFDRRHVLVIADLARIPIALTLCLASAFDSAALAIIAMALLAVGASFYDPVAAAATPNLVDAHALASAQSLMAMIWGAMLLVGAGLGGMIAAVFGAQTAFVIDALSFAASAWLVWRIRSPLQRPGADQTGDRGRLRDVLRFARTHRIVARLMLAKGGVSWANGTVGLLAAFAHSHFAGIAMATGLLFAARGLGALLGPLLARRVTGDVPTSRAIVVLCAASSLGYGVAYAFLPVILSFGLALILVVFAHLGGGAQWSLSTLGLQRETPDPMRGRVMALDYGLATLGIGSSALAAGILAETYGAAIATWSLSVVALGYGVAWLAWSWPATRLTSTTR